MRKQAAIKHLNQALRIFKMDADKLSQVLGGVPKGSVLDFDVKTNKALEKLLKDYAKSN